MNRWQYADNENHLNLYYREYIERCGIHRASMTLSRFLIQILCPHFRGEGGGVKIYPCASVHSHFVLNIAQKVFDLES
jgi:hypothetical protein